MENIKTIVFDLDGTIYQNNDFHRDYIRFLLDGSEKRDWEDSLVSYIDGIYCGRHLSMNTSYCSEIIAADTPEAYFSLLEKAALPQRGFERTAESENSIYLGDAWAVVTLIGKTLGLLEGNRSDIVYQKTREKMSTDGMRGNMRLRNAIAQLSKHYTTVLLTNSYRETAEDFLNQLGFGGVFQKMVFSARKPWGMVENLKKHCPDLDTQPQTFLSIGDNAFNDLMPLKQLGCKVLWVNPFVGIREPQYDLTVHTLDELAGCLENMYRRSERLL